jgi:light-regulated signal transduction histidine kinase (bacteriophytochrome)
MMPAQASASAGVDQSNCDREPIHIPGMIQPHGALVAFRESDWEVGQISANAPAMLGPGAEGAVGRPLGDVLGADCLPDLRAALKALDVERHPRFAFTLARSPASPVHLDAIVHRSEGTAVLELDGSRSLRGAGVPEQYHHLKNPLAALNDPDTLAGLCRAAAREARAITGFDRIMIYRFDREWNGTVVAEEKDPSLEPFLDLRYPASDIPRQARELYTRNWLRLIPDVAYLPVPILPAANPATGRPLDLSHSVLRSVSPMHIAYLKNMGVGASMSVSVLRGGKLWGLIACHHRTPRHVTHEMRLACEFLGQAFSLRVSALELAEAERYRLGLQSVQDRLRERMQAAADPLEGLAGEELPDLAGAQGAAVLYEGRCRLAGRTPTEAEVRDLCAWLDARGMEAPYVTESLPAEHPSAARYADAASGLLALAVPTTVRNYVLWFRPEVIRTVNWAGDPRKPMEQGPGGARLSPRRSFELWKETVRFTSQPWRDHEIEAARELRNHITAAALRRKAGELSASNEELEAFAYVASHDLKEPLRGIRNYAQFLAADYSGALGEEGTSRLATIEKLTWRMEELIQSLFEHSRAGKTALNLERVDLNAVFGEVREDLSAFLAANRGRLEAAGQLPAVLCDRVRVREIFSNLVTNGIKYNDSADRRVEVGVAAGVPRAPGEAAFPVLYVRDNGIGIPARHAETVFRMFKRLHGRDQYGGGAGAGLPIVKRLVDRHGGRIWMESEPGKGTVFYFTLGGGNA